MKEIISDLGSSLTKKVVNHLLEYHDINHKVTASYHQSANGSIEELVQSLQIYLELQAIR